MYNISAHPDLNKTYYSKGAYLTAAVLAFLMLFYCVTKNGIGNAVLYHADTLMVEELYQDLLFYQGSFSDWILPYSSYWLDFGLYLTVRHCISDVQLALAVYAGVQASILASCVWFALIPFAKDTQTKLLFGTFCYAAVLGIFTSGGDFILFNRVLFHVITLALAILAYGCTIRLFNRPSLLTGSVLVLAVICGVASDGIFLLWFPIPACAAIIAFYVIKQLTFRQTAYLLLTLLIAVIAGALLNALCSPGNQSANHVKPSIAKLFPSMWVIGIMALKAFCVSLPIKFFAALSILGLFIGLRSKNLRKPLFLLLAMLLSSIAGIAINGGTNSQYLLLLYCIPLAFGIPATVTVINKTVIAKALAFFSFIFLAITCLSYTTREKAEYYPPLVSCIDTIAKQNAVSHAIMPYPYARMQQYLSHRPLTVDPTHYKYFVLYDTLSTTHLKRQPAQMVVIDPSPEADSFKEATVLAINGVADKELSCSESNLKIWLYSRSPARIGTMKDYLLDSGNFEYSNPSKDMSLWQGKLELPSNLSVVKISSLYRLNRQWVVLSFQQPFDTIQKKTLRLYMCGNKSTWVQRLAEHMLPENKEAIDSLWIKMLWSEDIVINAENSFSLPEGGSAVFIRSPNRDTKKWTFLAIEQAGETFRFF